MTKLPDNVKEFFRKQGSKGGKKAAASMTKKEKTERARAGAKAKWAKRREAEGK